MRLFQKTVEVVFYDNWSFSLKLVTSSPFGNHLRASLLAMASENWDESPCPSGDKEECGIFDFEPRCRCLQLYTIARVANAQGLSTLLLLLYLF